MVKHLIFTGTEWTNRGGNLGGLITLGNVANVKITGGQENYSLVTDGTGNLSWDCFFNYFYCSKCYRIES